jgi:hypothetical protein
MGVAVITSTITVKIEKSALFRTNEEDFDDSRELVRPFP